MANDLLVGIGKFVPFDESEAESLERLARPCQYAKGDTIFSPGQVCRELFFLRQGLVRSFYIFDGIEVNLRLLCDDSAVLPFGSFVRRDPTDEYIQCLSDCRGFMLPLVGGTDGRFPMARHEHFMRILAERHYLSLERRLLMLQHKTAVERYAYFRQTMERKIVDETPAYHVASYLGITPESLSRIKRMS